MKETFRGAELLIEAARAQILSAHSDDAGKVRVIATHMHEGADVSCTITRSPAAFGAMRDQVQFRLAGKIVPRSQIDQLVSSPAKPAQNPDLLTALQAITEDAAEWHRKACEKVGELEGATVERDGDLLMVRGTRLGANVELRMRRIVKKLRLSAAFAQFPARIYVNGYFIPESLYKILYLDEEIS